MKLLLLFTLVFVFILTPSVFAQESTESYSACGTGTIFDPDVNSCILIIISDNVVINEVDINPPGDDSVYISEWVELYNPTDFEIDIGGWEIASTTVLKKTMIILDGTTIGPGQFLTYSYQTVWFTDSNESVELRDENGIVIDKTSLLSDLANDFTSWQRIYDGYDSDSSSDWKFVTSTAGSSNGELIESSTQPVFPLILNENHNQKLTKKIQSWIDKIDKIDSKINKIKIKLDNAINNNNTEKIQKHTEKIGSLMAFKEIYQNLINSLIQQIQFYS